MGSLAFTLLASLLLFNSCFNIFTVVNGSFHRQNRPCQEVYVVAEDESLHSISDRCGDPFILEHNPHIHDHDDVFPGLVIKITKPYYTRKFLSNY